MTNRVRCATQEGLGARVVELEATFIKGLPQFNITGLAGSSIQESKNRVVSALSNVGVSLPLLRLNVNLFPSDVPKSGSHFDLPIALLIICSKINLPLDEWFAFGEMGLDGGVRYTDLIYPLVLDISTKVPNAKVLVPECAIEVLSKIPNISIFCINNIKDAVSVLKGRNSSSRHHTSGLDFKFIEVGKTKYYYDTNYESDFSDVLGQESVKRAAIISASGFHNIMLEGSPGCGKSMIAERLRFILPPLSLEEVMDCAKIRVLNGEGLFFSPLRNFRSPHQSSSKSSIIGSSSSKSIKPGEVALAHNGVLFMDELPLFKKDILEAMREPLDNNKLLVSRVDSKVEYDTMFLFVCALNPCPCGNLFSQVKECRCNDLEISRYRNKISEAILDRIDIHMKMSECITHANSKDLSSFEMHKVVMGAFVMQKSRGQKRLNGKLKDSEIDEFCVLDRECLDIVSKATSTYNLSRRGVQKVKKLARTISDISGVDCINRSSLFEAFSYRIA